MNITDFCKVILKAPLKSVYDWSCETENAFFYLGWKGAADFKTGIVDVCSSDEQAIEKGASKQLLGKIERERNNLRDAVSAGKSIYYVLRVKQNPESDKNWGIVAKSKPMSNNTLILELADIKEHENGRITATRIDQQEARRFRLNPK
ncbi:hypothetical protein GCE9029_03442 [Grimontia celer]|uniref:Uncharacterized protein n=2 Tax=Grimontia celer TaxID=1796497 RepID=A0A128F8H6_9GAMM|nr:hypothetical protein GCE9029_03442 [Grimontia celer]